MSDDYPGHEYALHFSAGEYAKFLVITPKYSKATDGNCELMAVLKNPSEETPVSNDFFMTHVTILDEDEPEPVTVSMAEDTITAEDGVAAITVTREGRINSIVGVNVVSCDGSAVMGDDYSGINAKLYFPLGITERTVEIPVGQGAVEKDFSITITPVTECQIARATTRVVIPASTDVEIVEESSLMDEDILGEQWNLKGRYRNLSGKVSFDDDYSVTMKTKLDKNETQYIVLNTDKDYAWDGVRVNYDFHTWYSKGKFKVERWDQDTTWTSLYIKDWGDSGWKRDQSVDVYYKSSLAPIEISLDDKTYSVFNILHDSHSDLYIKSVYPLKRHFNITIDNPEWLDFIGLEKSQENELNPYESFLVNGSTYTNFSILTGDSFSVSPLENADPKIPRYTRMVGLDAVKDGETFRVLTLNGESEIANVRLDPDLINTLASKGYITWKKDEEGSRTGTIHFRPVFDYKDVTVEVKDSQYGSFKTANLSPGTHEKTFHMGDTLTMESELSITGSLSGLEPDGYGFTSRKEKNGDYLHKGTDNYINGSATLTLRDPYYLLEPIFTDSKNQVVVEVKDSDLQYFDVTKGLFATAERSKDGDTWKYVTEKKVPANKVMELQAVPKDTEHVPVWTTTQDSLSYSGQAFYFMTGPKESDNTVTLTVNRSAADHAWYSFSGNVYSTTRNLSTGEDLKADENTKVEEIVNKANGAVVSSGTDGTVTDNEGAFTLPPQYLAGGTTLRYTVTYNGIVNIREVRLPSAESPTQSVSYYDPEHPGETLTADAVPVTANLIDAASTSGSNVHFGKVSISQAGQASGVTSALCMNGGKVVITLKVEPGQPYLSEGELLTEQVEDVQLFFRSTFNGDIHGSWTASEGSGKQDYELRWDPENMTATLTFQKFAPDQTDKYDVGDVLCAQLSTDRRVDGSTFYADNGTIMTYEPVSTGITVTSDLNYEPETMKYNMPFGAENFFAQGGGAGGSGTRASYGQFPFIGEITFAVNILSPMMFATSGADTQVDAILDDMAPEVEGGYDFEGYGDMGNNGGDNGGDNGDPGDEPSDNYQNEGYSRSTWNFNVAIRIADTAYGGTRFMFALVVTYGGAGSYKSQQNPYYAKDVFQSRMNANLTPNEYHLMTMAGKSMRLTI